MSDPQSRRRSWVPVPAGSDFPLENLPYGVVRTGPGQPARVVTRIGDQVVDLDGVQADGLLPAGLPAAIFTGTLNRFMATGPAVWSETRRVLTELLSDANGAARAERHMRPVADVEVLLPIDVADYVDFYSSEQHARNMGLIFRPGADPLMPNWKHLPVGYHGRSGTVVVSGTPVSRPLGLVAEGGGAPRRRPSGMLDIELEVGSVVGVGSRRGSSIAVDRADEHVFGLVLLNDWSARDIQAYESVPLGPFLGKSFATSVSPWVVTLEALRPYLVPSPPQDPEPAPYLRGARPWSLDLQLEVRLASATMDPSEAVTVCRTPFRDMYWTFAQQLAHLTGNGAATRPGDLHGSGTVSGPRPGSFGSFLEITWRGRDPITLPTGETRTFVEDGDTVTLHGWCGGEGDAAGRPRVGFGTCTGTVTPPSMVP